MTSIRFTTSHVPADHYGGEGNSDPQDFYSGDRICPPGIHGPGRRALRTLGNITLVLTCGWGLFTFRETAAHLVTLLFAPTQSTALKPPADTAEITPAPPLPETKDVATTPADTAGTPIPESQTKTAEAGAATAEDVDAAAEPEPLPPPNVDPTDPYQKRALAAGLSPDLSRVLLRRLTDADYRNAAVAVDTALKKTADSATYVYPAKPKADLALFEVHFVPGAPANCRRYVVAITKDGWLTTAHPMEKCGIPHPSL